jgi:hypothetical protein
MRLVHLILNGRPAESRSGRNVNPARTIRCSPISTMPATARAFPTGVIPPECLSTPSSASTNGDSLYPEKLCRIKDVACVVGEVNGYDVS